MKVIIDRNTFIRGVPFEAGTEPVEVAEGVGKELIALGKAHVYAEKKETESEPTAEKSKEGKGKKDADANESTADLTSAEDEAKG